MPRPGGRGPRAGRPARPAHAGAVVSAAPPSIASSPPPLSPLAFAAPSPRREGAFPGTRTLLPRGGRARRRSLDGRGRLGSPAVADPLVPVVLVPLVPFGLRLG